MGIIEKDVQVAALSFKADDLQLMNILGNRIMSDSVFLGNVRQAIRGFFFKQVALTYLILKPQLVDSEMVEAKLIGEKYITALSKTGEDADQTQLWADYHQFNLDIRKYPATGFNKEMAAVYGDEPEVTTVLRQKLISFLTANKDILFDGQNNLLKGILNELQRVGLALGYQVADTILYSCILALDRYYDYFRVRYATQSNQIDKEAVKVTIFPYIDRIVAISSTQKLSYEDVNGLLWDLIKGWREFFILYMELLPRVPTKQLELSQETKSKLSDVLGKALQKELKT